MKKYKLKIDLGGKKVGEVFTDSWAVNGTQFQWSDDFGITYVIDASNTKVLAEIILTTEDGIDKVVNDKLWVLDKNFNSDYMVLSAYPKEGVEQGMKFFDSPDMLAAYIKKNQPKPIFTTEDGVDIFKGTLYYFVQEGGSRVDTQRSWQGMTLDNNLKRFSTKELAEAYVESLKPKVLFTTEDGVGILDRTILYYVTNSWKVSSFEYIHNFSTEAKAQEYMDWNKPQFSANDIKEALNSVHLRVTMPRVDEPHSASLAGEAIQKLIDSKKSK